MKCLDNKTVIITGGAGRIGREFVRETARNGANVVLVDINEEIAGGVIGQVKKDTGNDNILFQKCDITKAGEISSLLDSTQREFGRIDALVNNAYPRNKNYGRKLEDVTYEDFCENVNLHLGGYFLMSKMTAEVMKKQNLGNIVSISSVYGFSAPRFDIYEGTPMTMPVEYAVIKAGIINFTKYLSTYLGKYNIRANCISPGGIFDGQPDAFVRKYSSKVALGGRMANVDDVSGALLFLLGDGSKYMTGQNLVVDGGFTL